MNEKKTINLGVQRRQTVLRADAPKCPTFNNLAIMLRLLFVRFPYLRFDMIDFKLTKRVHVDKSDKRD